MIPRGPRAGPRVRRGSAGGGRSGGRRGRAKMAAVLQQLLERAELAKLPRPVQGKLERFLADQQSEIDGLRGRHERFKVESGESGQVGAQVRGQRERGRPRAARCAGSCAARGLSAVC